MTARGPVGRQSCGDVFPAVEVRVLRPSAVVRHHQGLVPVKRLDLPDAVVLDVLVLVRTFAPTRALAELSGKNDIPPGGSRGRAIRGHRHDGHELHVLVDLAWGQTRLTGLRRMPLRRKAHRMAECMQVFANAPLADIDSVEPDFDGAVGCEQARGVVPESAVEVVAVRALQSLDIVTVLEQRLAGFESGDAGLELPGSGSDRCAHWMHAGCERRQNDAGQAGRACAGVGHLTRPLDLLLGHDANDGTRSQPGPSIGGNPCPFPREWTTDRPAPAASRCRPATMAHCDQQGGTS